MDRLRGFVQQFKGTVGGNGGDDATISATREQTEEILNKLPLTKSFISELPRNDILTLSSTNNSLALSAQTLITHLNMHLTTHATTTTALHTHITQLSTLSNDLSAASAHASRLHTQLLELTTLIGAAETAAAAQSPLSEEGEFEQWARRRKEEVEDKKREWRTQLERFERERIAIGAAGEPVVVAGQGKKGKGATGGGGGAGIGGLEEVVLQEGEEGLEDFLGGGFLDGPSTSSTARTPGTSAAPTTTASPSPSSGSTTPKKQKLTPKSPKNLPLAKPPPRPKNKPKPKQRMAIMADEDIEDEEELKKWY